ncbi:MAG: bifunctional phosphoglucose/phosphomannose isomerase [Omnitrophica bacterium RIFCSPHIGHO2_02_FULL_46_11]|nr:MAG: bifunctional phosphoglucose/phosphomannose isomerase [Omnitrophica bacterium RIFCSPHIGHO2_02_FULL_46_11]
MNLLDQKEAIERVDRQNMRKLIHDFSAQMRQAEEIGTALHIDPALGTGLSKIVFSGLGGSAIGADFIRSYLAYDFPIPIFVNRHYQLPEFVDKTTLLVASSYSGDTEETLSALKDGMKRGARILAITSGGELIRLARANSFPFIQIPGGLSPRAALGYSVIPLLVALSKIGFKQAYRPIELQEAIGLLKTLSESQYDTAVPHEKNLAKQLAELCFGKYPIIYAGVDYFDVVALRWRGQIEENAKALASHHVLPEMNHNELVGWRYPQQLLKEAVVFFLKDPSDHKRVQMRMNLTRSLIERSAGKVVELSSQGKGLLARMFSLIHLGDWVSFYLAVLYQVDPTPVEVIQHLKSELAKEPAAR